MEKGWQGKICWAAGWPVLGRVWGRGGGVVGYDRMRWDGVRLVGMLG